MFKLNIQGLREAALYEFNPFANLIIIWATFVLAFFTTNISAMTYVLLPDEVQMWFVVVIYFFIAATIAHFVFAVFFSTKKRAYKHQKFQAVVMCICLCKAIFDLYVFYFILNDAKNLPTNNTLIGLFCLLGGILCILIMTLMRLKGARYINKYRMVEKDGKPAFVLVKRKGRHKFIKYMLYLFILIVLNALCRSFGVLIEGYALFLLYHAVIFQWGIATKLSKGILIANYKFKRDDFNFTDDSYKGIKIEVLNPGRPGLIKLILLKSFQYLLLFALIVYMAYINIEASSAVHFSVYLLCYYLLLKWISRYQLEKAGSFLVNGFLTIWVIGVVILYTVILNGEMDLPAFVPIQALVISVVVLIFLNFYDYLGYLRNR